MSRAVPTPKICPAQPAQQAGQDRSLRIAAAILDPRLFARAAPCLPARALEGLAATYHFTFTGREPAEATIVIRDRTLKVMDGHHGEPDLRVIADGDTWLRFLRKEASLPWAFLRRRVRLKARRDCCSPLAAAFRPSSGRAALVTMPSGPADTFFCVRLK